MIHFKRVWFKNYLIFKEGEIPLENQGVVFVRGINHDEGNGSNGVGKTACLESIKAPLFVKTSKGAKDDLVLDGKDLEVGVEFKLGADDYAVTLYRGHKDMGDALVIEKNGKLDPDAPKKKITLLENYIKSLIPISPTEYDHFVHVPQGAFSRLIEGTPGERYQFISDLFSLGVYDNMLEKIDELHVPIIDELIKLHDDEVRLEQLQQELTKYEDENFLIDKCQHQTDLLNYAAEQKNAVYAELDNLKALQTTIDAIKRGKENYEALKSVMQSLVVDLLQEYDIGLVDFGDTENAETAYLKVTKFINGLTATVNETNKAIHHIDQKTKLTEQLKQNETSTTKSELVTKINNIQSKLTDHNNNLKFSRDREKVKQDLLKYESLESSEAITAAYEKSYETMTKTSAKLNAAKEELEASSDLEGKLVCDKCKSKLNPEATKQRLQELTTEINGLAVQLNISSNLCLKLKEQQTKSNEREALLIKLSGIPEPKLLTTDEITSLQQEQKQLESERDKAVRYESIKAQIDQIEHVFESKAELEQKRSRAESTKSKLEKYKESLNSVIATFKTLPKNYKAFELTIDYTIEIQKLTIVYNELINGYTSASVETNALVNTLQALQTLKENIVELEKKLATKPELLTKDKIYKALKKAYDRKGLKLLKIKKILQAALMVLPTYTKLFFNNLRFTASPDEDRLNLMVEKTTATGTVTYDVKTVSGGESCRLIICLILAFNEINNQNKRSNILILDEIDHYMDEIGTAAFYNDIIPIAREKYESIFIISHATELFGRVYDKTLLVERKQGISTISLQ